MLVLSRKKGQSIRIGDDIEVVVLDVQGDRISIGIEAPVEVDIYRSEIYQEVEDANRRSVTREQVLAMLGGREPSEND